MDRNHLPISMRQGDTIANEISRVVRRKKGVDLHKSQEGKKGNVENENVDFSCSDP